jgi:hypothetical protein
MCDHPDLRYVEPADAISKFIRRGMEPLLIDLVQSPDPGDDADIHECEDCGELFILIPDEGETCDRCRVWKITDQGKRTEDS